MSNSTGDGGLRPRNRILASLSPDELARIQPQLELVPLAYRQSLYEPAEPIPYIYFPENAVVSLLTVMPDGSSIEVATIGNEGMVGLPVFLGSISTAGRAFSQVPGTGLRMKTSHFKDEVGRGGQLQQRLHLYTQALFDLIAQSAACNRLHTMEQRCARWLLMTHDRVGADDFPMTHEFLAQMLGVRRATVTVALGALQEAGRIRYARGLVSVVDRAGLEQASCDCYAIVKGAFVRLLGWTGADEPSPSAGAAQEPDEAPDSEPGQAP